MSRIAFLRLEWTLSLALVLVSGVWATLRSLPLAPLLVPTPGRVLAGALAGALLWSTIPVLLCAPSMQRVWRDVLRPFAATITTTDVLVIATLSGLTEELFFRGVLLPETGVVVSSLCFGALHALTATYFVWATAVGAVMSALTLAAGSALAGTTGTEFQTMYTTLLNWATGFLGKSIAIAAFILGAGIGIARSSPIPALAGVVFALFMVYVPSIIDSIMTAVI